MKINSQLAEGHTINHRIRQGCPLSPTVFNINLNEIIAKGNQIYTKGITLSISTEINTLLFADDQVIITESKDN